MKKAWFYTALAASLVVGLAGCGEAPAESARPDEAVLKEAAGKPQTGKVAPAAAGGGMPQASPSGLDPTK